MPVFKHGMSRAKNNRLYQCWKSMRKRSRNRVGCSICPAWDSFVVFQEWALSNGYNDDLVLCRTGDKGDYEPSNVRWDTQASNAVENLSKTYKFLFDGKIVTFHNLNKFCRENNLSPQNMGKVNLGKQKTCQGYTRYKE